MNSFETFEQVLRARLDFTHVLMDGEARQRWADSIVRLVRDIALKSYRNGLHDARPGRMARGPAPARPRYRTSAR